MHGYAMKWNKQELGGCCRARRLQTGVLGGSKITIPKSKAQSCHPCLSRRGSRPSAVKPSTGLCIDCEQQLAKESAGWLKPFVPCDCDGGCLGQ